MSAQHVYVHVPFCARKCSYCDFAIAVRRTTPVDEYLTALGRELSLRYPAKASSPIETLYLGGGTPSRLGPDGIGRVLNLVRSHWELAPNAEVTIEVNPDDVVAADARRWREAGVTRVSLGAQSFSDAALQWMHRTHNATRVRLAVDALRAAGLTNYSLDLIFALPSALKRNWEHDLAAVTELEPTHVSLYGLTIEPITPLGRRHGRGEIVDAPEEGYEAEYLAAHDVLSRAGFEHYEVSNFAQPGHRARHNSAYWRNVPYVGIGPGAHEFNGLVRRWNAREYAEWVARIAQGIDPVEGTESLTDDNRMAETVYLGLRTIDGLAIDDAEKTRIAPWVVAGWASIGADNRLRLSPLGWLRLDSLSADLAHHRSRG